MKRTTAIVFAFLLIVLPALHGDHELNTLEPFAPNFAECIKRFSQKN